MYVNVLSVHADSKTESYAAKVEEYKNYAYESITKLEDVIVPALKNRRFPEPAPGPSGPASGPGSDDGDNSGKGGRGGGGGTVLVNNTM